MPLPRTRSLEPSGGTEEVAAAAAEPFTPAGGRMFRSHSTDQNVECVLLLMVTSAQRFTGMYCCSPKSNKHQDSAEMETSSEKFGQTAAKTMTTTTTTFNTADIITQ